MRTVMTIVVLSLAQLGPCSLFRSEPTPPPPPVTPPTPQPQPLPEPPSIPSPKITTKVLDGGGTADLWLTETQSKLGQRAWGGGPRGPWRGRLDNHQLIVGVNPKDESRIISLIRFDTKNLPLVAEQRVFLELYCLNAALTEDRGWHVHLAIEDWVHSLVPDSEGVWLESISSDDNFVVDPDQPVSNKWCRINITDWYQEWREKEVFGEGGVENYGLVFWPDTSSTWYEFASSEHPNHDLHPRLVVEYQPKLALLLPLPGGKEWLLTVEAGGRTCDSPDLFHEGVNYHSLDFDDLSQPAWEKGNVPVYAPAEGQVVENAYTAANGNYLVLEHDFDGEISTGYTTRYLHLEERSSLKEDDVVQPGQQIGIVGNTGESSTGSHLHFGIRFDNDGSQRKGEIYHGVTLEGLKITDYKVECRGREWTKFYRSTNAR